MQPTPTPTGAVHITARAKQPGVVTYVGVDVAKISVMAVLPTLLSIVAVMAVKAMVIAMATVVLETATLTMTMGQHLRRQKQWTASLRGASGRHAVAVVEAGTDTVHQL